MNGFRKKNRLPTSTILYDFSPKMSANRRKTPANGLIPGFFA